MKKLLFISGDIALIKGQKGPFYYLLEEFSKYWERIDIISPRVSKEALAEAGGAVLQPFPNVFLHPSPWHLIFQPWFIAKKGKELFKEHKFDLFGVHSYPPFYNEMGGLKLHKKIKVPFVLECHHITGGADFLLKVATKDIPTYEQFIIQTLTALPDVQHLKTLVVLSTLKQETKIPIGEIIND